MSIDRSYDRLAERYAEVFFAELDRKPFDRERLDALGLATLPGLPVVEVGCGPGHVGRYLHDRGHQVQGFDLSHGMVEVARRLNPTMRIHRADLRDLPLRDAHAGGALAFYCLIHLPRTEVTAALAELCRVLAPGAPLLASVHRGEGEVRTQGALETDVTLTATLFSTAELASYAEAAGLVIDRIDVRPPYAFEYPSQRIYLAAHRSG